MSLRALAGALSLCLAVSGCFFNEPRVFTDNPRLVPDVTGETLETATEVLESEGFLTYVVLPDTTEVDASACPGAEVVSQDPAGGDGVVKASTITLTVGRCP